MELLIKLRSKIAEMVYWASLSQGVYGVLLMSFVLVTTNLDKIQTVISLNPYIIVIVGSPLVFSLVIVFGFILDKVRYAHTYASHANRRNPEITEILARVRKIEERINNESQRKTLD